MNVGERIGDYEIVEVLGAGGMGEVFKVRNSLSGRIEAMKVLHSNLSSDKDLAERFQREIRVQAALDHPHIARLNTAQLVTNAQGANQLIMVMEYVDGRSLAQMLENGPISLSDCITYSTQVLDALGYAHEHGVVHRDIKPANIMCTRQGSIKLMDFGIARMAADQKLTDTGKTVGSLHYMSPEQIRGTEPDPRSDIYSFGITLYEMVTGKKPFEGSSNYSIMSAHLQQQAVPPINVSAGVPEALSQIILMAIAKEPAQRFQSAKAFSGALQSVQPGPTMSMVTPAAYAPAPMAPPVGPAPISALPNYSPQSVAPQQMPPAAATIAPVQRSMRGLYMVLGSMVTILVLAVAAFEAPKYFHTGANTKAEPAVKTSVTTPAVVTPVAPTKEVSPPPAVDAAAAPDPVPAADTAVPATPPPPVIAPVVVTPRPANPVVAAKLVQVPQTTAQATPQVSSQVARPPQAPPPAAVPPPIPAVNRELNEVREQYNELSIRSNASHASLDSMAQQIQSQGLGLRRDIVEARTRLDYQMKEAMDSIRAGDVNGAREHLQFAHGNLDVIDKFLGH
jgi:serine/threonine-protein kinase